MWGQLQAGRGDCALMRWTGHGAGLPLPIQPATSGAALPLPAGPANSAAALAAVSRIHERPDLSPSTTGAGCCAPRASRIRPLPSSIKLLVSDASPELKASVAQELNQMSMIDEYVTPDVLVAIFRFSRDRNEQRTALATLNLLGLVEAL